MGGNTAGTGEMVEETTGRTIRCVDGTQETPCLGKEFTDSGCLELSEEGTSVNGPEMADITHPVQLFGDDGETRRLLQVETCW